MFNNTYIIISVRGQGSEPTARGNIFMFDFKKHSRGVHALDILGDLDRTTFSPMGLNIWRDTSRSMASLEIKFQLLISHNRKKYFYNPQRRSYILHIFTHTQSNEFNLFVFNFNFILATV